MFTHIKQYPYPPIWDTIDALERKRSAVQEMIENCILESEILDDKTLLDFLGPWYLKVLQSNKEQIVIEVKTVISGDTRLLSFLATVSPLGVQPIESSFLVFPDSCMNDERLDMVNHPDHYNQGGVECIEALKSALSPFEYRGFLKGNVLKYIWREADKGGLEDLKKAEFYLKLLIAEGD